jgi:hypothetical protein
MPSFPDFLNTNNHQLWLMVGVCLAAVFTVEAVEEAVEGAWPHERRPSRMAMTERRAQPFWGLVALLVLPGAILEIAILAVLAWRHETKPSTLVIGSILLGIGWVIFLLTSFDRFRVRRIFTSIGPVAPIALIAILIVADFLLIVGFLDIRPSLQSIRDALPYISS